MNLRRQLAEALTMLSVDERAEVANLGSQMARQQEEMATLKASHARTRRRRHDLLLAARKRWWMERQHG